MNLNTKSLNLKNLNLHYNLFQYLSNLYYFFLKNLKMVLVFSNQNEQRIDLKNKVILAVNELTMKIINQRNNLIRKNSFFQQIPFKNLET